MEFKKLLFEVNQIKQKELTGIKILIISNIKLEPYIDLYLTKEFYKESICPKLDFINFEEYKQNLNKIEDSDIIIVLLNYENLFPDTHLKILSGSLSKEQAMKDIMVIIDSIYKDIANMNHKQIIWFGMEDYFEKSSLCLGNSYNKFSLIDEINNRTKDIVPILVDLKKIIANIGINNTYNYKNKYRWNCPYSEKVIIEIAHEVFKQYMIIMGMGKKCIILDCDNVLWGGILSEDGIENIQLGNIGIGSAYKEFQRYLLNLFYLGIILTISSKNDSAEVLDVFDNHSEMILKKSHIACHKINWNNKVDNIKSISEFLNIGLDSIVFIDDSYFEIEAVNELLPDVTTILFDIETIYEQLSCFNLSYKAQIKDIIIRNDTFKTNEKRNELQTCSKSYDDYLSALETKMLISEATISEYSRISELSQRVNKCSNGKRYTALELKNLVEHEEYILKAVYVSDKFGDLGLVGAIGIQRKNLDFSIDLFCLSCRALGRFIEEKMLSFVTVSYKITEYNWISTGKNDVILELLNRYIKLQMKPLN